MRYWGTEVQSSRDDPKSSKNQPVTAGFLWLFSERGIIGEKPPTQGIDFTVKFQLFTSPDNHQTPRSWHH